MLRLTWGGRRRGLAFARCCSSSRSLCRSGFRSAADPRYRMRGRSSCRHCGGLAGACWVRQRLRGQAAVGVLSLLAVRFTSTKVLALLVQKCHLREEMRIGSVEVVVERAAASFVDCRAQQEEQQQPVK